MAGVEMRKVVDECRDEVASGGFTVIAIIGDAHGCDWAYTVGLANNHDHPELLLIGLEAVVAGELLEVLGAEVAGGGRIDPLAVIRLDDDMCLLARQVDRLWLSQGDWFNLGREVMSELGHRWPDCLQLTWPDCAGGFPEPGGDSLRQRQPLLFSS